MMIAALNIGRLSGVRSFPATRAGGTSFSWNSTRGASPVPVSTTGRAWSANGTPGK